MLRRAWRAERRTLGRFLQPLQHKSCQTFCRFLDMMVGEAKSPLRVKRRVFVAQAQAALWTLTHPAPLAGHDRENLLDQLLRGPVGPWSNGPEH